MARRVVALLLVASLVALAPGVRAGEERGLYGDTYTAEELAGLDRALHAANMTRADLTFRKDMTKGHACFTSVRDMLRDPLAIAPFLDGRARRTRSWMGARGVTSLVHDVILSPYEIPAERSREPSLAGPRWSWDDAETPATPEALLGLVRAALEVSGNPDDTVRRCELFGEPLPAADLLRLALPPSMAWHDVFASPFDPQRTTALEAELEQRTDAWLHETMATVVFESMVSAWHGRFGVAPAVFRGLPRSAFPTDAPLVFETPSTAASRSARRATTSTRATTPC